MTKRAAWALLLGTMLGWSGCLGDWAWNQAVWGSVSHGAMEYFLDNGAVYDLFEG